jgi:hypothetical protein
MQVTRLFPFLNLYILQELDEDAARAAAVAVADEHSPPASPTSFDYGSVLGLGAHDDNAAARGVSEVQLQYCYCYTLIISDTCLYSRP